MTPGYFALLKAGSKRKPERKGALVKKAPSNWKVLLLINRISLQLGNGFESLGQHFVRVFCIHNLAVIVIIVGRQVQIAVAA